MVAPIPRLLLRPVHTVCVLGASRSLRWLASLQSVSGCRTRYMRSGGWLKLKVTGMERALQSHEAERLGVARDADDTRRQGVLRFVLSPGYPLIRVQA